MSKCGIYRITNRVNDKFYIGRSEDIEKRWYIHVNKLDNNNHVNSDLQKDWNKYGEDSFDFEILTLCDYQDLDREESNYILGLQAVEKGYNKLRTLSYTKMSSNRINLLLPVLMDYIENKGKSILFYSNIAIDLNISLNDLAILIKAIDDDVKDEYNLIINSVNHFTLANSYIEIDVKDKFQEEMQDAVSCLSI